MDSMEYNKKEREQTLSLIEILGLTEDEQKTIIRLVEHIDTHIPEKLDPNNNYKKVLEVYIRYLLILGEDPKNITPTLMSVLVALNKSVLNPDIKQRSILPTPEHLEEVLYYAAKSYAAGTHKKLPSDIPKPQVTQIFTTPNTTYP